MVLRFFDFDGNTQEDEGGAGGAIYVNRFGEIGDEQSEKKVNDNSRSNERGDLRPEKDHNNQYILTESATNHPKRSL